MRIVVNDIAASHGGAMTILRQFYDFVVKNDCNNEWIFLLGDNYLKEIKNIKIITLPKIKNNHLRKIWFDCITGRYFIQSLKPDIVISLQNIITFGINIKQIVYVHQSIPFQNFRQFSFFKSKERSLAFIQYIIGWFIKKSIQHANHVIVQSNWMAKAIEQKLHLSNSKITIIRPSIDQIKDIQAKRPFCSNRFFYPTNNELYKNNELILQACNLLNSQDYHDFTVELTLPTGTLKHPNIICLGRISYLEVQQHYLDSILLFPSYIETVGMPLLEACAHGTPIIAADAPHVSDILKEYGNYWIHSPFNASELSKLMKNCIDGKIAQDLDKKEKTISLTDEWLKIYEIIF